MRTNPFLSVLRQFDFHFQKMSGVGLPLGIKFQRHGSAAPKSTMQEEVDSVQIGKIESFHLSLDHRAEMAVHTFLREQILQERICIRVASDNSDIYGVAFIAATCVGQVNQSVFHW